MAMTYVRYSRLLISSLCLSVLLCACGGSPVKPPGAQAEEELKLVPTLNFVPVLKTNKEGEIELYEATLNPYIKRGKIRKASVTKYIEARRAFQAGQYEQSEALLEQLVKEDDSLSGPWVMRGDIALKSDDTTKARDFFNKALAINPDNINAWLKLAYAQRLDGDFLLAQNTYARALTVWKDCPETHLNLAILYDVYLNLPLRAQKHMEAYIFLTGDKNAEVASWYKELKSRTGVAASLPLDKPLLKPLS